MSNKRDQHFVPQFYMKNFSGDGRSVSVVNVTNNKIIEQASISGQCQRSFLYGKDLKLENIFSSIEGRASQSIRKLIETREPASEGQEHKDFLFFLSVQNHRTTQSAEEMHEMLDKTMKHLFKNSMASKGIGEEDLDKVKITWKQPFHFGLIAALDMHVLLLDLKPALFINRSKTGFITSDHPTVFYNQLLEKRTYTSNVGYVQTGLQIFLPISADILLCYYDSKSYGFGPKRPRTIELDNELHVIELNNLQLISAKDNVYYDKGRNIGADILRSFQRIKGHRRDRHANLHIQDQHSPDPKIRRELVGMYRQDVRVNLNLPAIKILHAAKSRLQELMSKAVTPRDEFVARKHDEFSELVKKGMYKKGEFFTYLKASVAPKPTAVMTTR